MEAARPMILEDPGAAPASPACAIRRRLMERVADTDTSHLTIEAAEGEWQPFMEGVEMKVLREHEGTLTYLLRMAPGASMPAHRHDADEECLVLSGRVHLGTHIEVGPGGYHLARRGSLHASLSTPTGAVLFLRGAVPDAGQILA